MRLRPTVDSGLILLGLAALAVGQPHQLIGDGYERYAQLSTVLGEHRLPGGDYSLVGPLFATPFWLLDAVAYFNATVIAAGLGVTWLLLRRRADGDLLRAFLLLVVAGSMVAVAAADFYGEAFTAMAVGVGLLAVALGHRLAGWVAVVVGAVNTPASLVGLGLVSAVETVRARRFRYLVPFAAGVALVLTEILLRHGGYVGNRGSRTVMPYSGEPGFSYPFLLGVAALLFSFGRGLVFFLPGLVLPARQRLRARSPELEHVYLLWTVFLAGLVVAYASWWAWHGGQAWGPRFLLVGVLPASLALAVRLRDPGSRPLADLATLAVLALSMWIGAASTAFNQLWPPQCGGDTEFLCHFTPEFSPLWYPFVARPDLDVRQWLTLGYHAVVLGWLAVPVISRIGTSSR